MNFYPDFAIKATNILVEVFGFYWKPHIERTREKIRAFSKAGYAIIIYTYPNCVKEFQNSQAIVVTEPSLLLEQIKLLSQAVVSSRRSETS